MAKFYFQQNGQKYVMVISYEKVRNFYQLIEVRKHKTLIMKTEDISGKYIYLEIGSEYFGNRKQYIVSQPNCFEKD